MTTYASRLERAFTGLTTQPEITKIMHFVNECSKSGGGMANGNRLAICVNELLGHGAVVQFVSADDADGGEL